MKINDVQTFNEFAGDSYSCWSLLVGREVSRFNERVKYRYASKIRRSSEEIKDIEILFEEEEERGIKFFEAGIIRSIKLIKDSLLTIRVKYEHKYGDYADKLSVEYEKEAFVGQFNIIFRL